MTKMMTTQTWVGGGGYRKVLLMDAEEVVKSDVTLHSGPQASWPLGKLFLTTQRLIWTPSVLYMLHFPIRRVIPLSVIDDVNVCRLSIWEILSALSADGWAVAAGGKTYQFCFPFGLRSKLKTEDWIQTIRECAANS